MKPDITLHRLGKEARARHGGDTHLPGHPFAELRVVGSAELRDVRDRQIRVHDKTLLVLSEASIKSDWVENELDMARRKEKKISEQILEQLVKTFVTGLEREDIEALARALYRIPKGAEKLADRFLLAAPHLQGVDFSKQAGMMLKATDTRWAPWYILPILIRPGLAIPSANGRERHSSSILSGSTIAGGWIFIREPKSCTL